MAQWVKCTGTDDQSKWVNTDVAVVITWSDEEECSTIRFSGSGEVDVKIAVRERPEAILGNVRVPPKK